MVEVFGRVFSIRELDELPPPLLAHVIRRFKRETSASQTVVQIQVVQIAMVVIWIGALLFVRFESQRISPTTAFFLSLAAVVVIVGSLGRYSARLLRKELERFYRDVWPAGLPRFCLNCDYDLRASVEVRCPECGAPLPEADSRRLIEEMEGETKDRRTQPPASAGG